MQVSEIAEKLVRQKQSGQSTILFLGAGASVTANIPTTKGIVQYINESPEFDHIENSDTQNYFDIMGQLEPGERKKLLSYFINKAKINETHFIAGQLMRLGYIDCIITTNFDPLIKNSANLFHTNYQIIDIANNVNLTGHSITFPSIIYLHGEYRNVWQLNTNEELKENINDISSVISNIASKESTWLIVGYSGNDLVFDELAKVEVFNHGLYWIGHNQQSPIKKVQEQLLSKSTKNARLVNGHTADSFFKKLFDEIIKQAEHNERNLGNSLNTILVQRKQQNQLGSTQEINTANQIQLTRNCKKWVKQRAGLLTSINKGNNFKEESFLTNLAKQLFSSDTEKIQKIKAYVSNSLFEEALKLSVEEIKENSENPLGYYYKAVSLGEIAGEIKNPAERKEYYKRMNFAFKEAREFAVKSDKEYDEISRIKAIKNVVWQTEHNRAVKLAVDDELKERIPEPLKKSVQHLNNAILVNPASTLSWDVLSQVAAMNADFVEAARAKRQYLNMVPTTAKETNDFIQLAQYHYNQDNQKDVLKTLQEAKKLYPEDEQIISNLADTYTRLGQSEKAISTVEALVDQHPKNPQYRLSYGTQIYQKALSLRDNISANNKEILDLRNKLQNASGPESQKLKQKISQLEKDNQEIQPQIKKLTNQAEQEIKKSLELRPDSAPTNNVLGAIYQNRAKDVFDERDRKTEDHEKAAKLDKQGKELLRTAMSYYERATEIDPQNRSYWKSLFQIYTALDKDKEAQRAREKAGM